MSHKNLSPTASDRLKRRHRSVQPGGVVDHRLGRSAVDARWQTDDRALLQRTVTGRGAESVLAQQPEDDTVREGDA